MSMKRFALLFLTILLCLPLSVQAASYFVSKEGGASDSNNGTSTGTPWLTINKVNISSFSAGDTISFRKGDTWLSEQLVPPSNGSSGNPITFTSYGSGNKPKFDGQGGTFGNGLIYVSAKNYVTIDGFELTNTTRDLIVVNAGASGTSTGVIVRNSEMHGVTEAGFTCVNILNYSPGTTNSVAKGSLTNVLIENNLVYACDWNGIRMNGGVTNSTIQNNIVHDLVNGGVGHNGIDIKGGTGSSNTNENISVLNNEVYNTQTGIFFADVINSLVEGNKLHNLNPAGTSNASIESYPWNVANGGQSTVSSLSGNTFRRNIFYNNLYVGLHVQQCTSGCLSYNNTFYNQGTGGSGGAILSQSNTGFVSCNQLAWNTGGHNALGLAQCASQVEWVASDPRFANPGAGDFRLCTAVNTPVSGCAGASSDIDAGSNVGLAFNGAAPDLGALETGGASDTVAPAAPSNLRVVNP